MDQSNTNNKENLVIELNAKKAGLIFLVILLIVFSFFFFIKGSGKNNTVQVLGNKTENKAPVASFKLTKECYDYLPCQFDAIDSYDPDGHITKYEWYLNGSLQTDVGPLDVATLREGKYNVTLTVYDNNTIFSSVYKIIYFKQRYEFKIPSTTTKEAQITTIKKLCKEQIKPMSYSNYYSDYINDFHQHLYGDVEPLNYTITLLTAMNEFGVKRTAISQVGAGVEGDRNFEREKDQKIAEIAKLCPERFDAMLSAVYPDDPSSVSYVKENLESGAFKGLS